MSRDRGKSKERLKSELLMMVKVNQILEILKIVIDVEFISKKED